MSALAVGATVVLYDGSPFVPNPSVLWDCVDNFGSVLPIVDMTRLHLEILLF